MEDQIKTPEFREGEMTKKIEECSARIPSKYFLCSALTIMGLSFIFKCKGHKHIALFLGQWVSPILIMGLYNKLVKIHGHD